MSKTLVKRFDKGVVSKAVKTPQGYLRAPITATRIGVFNYRMPDGSVLRELRCPEEVFKQDSLETLACVPVTDDHPEVALLDAENTRMYSRGYTSDQVTHDDTNVLTSATITDSELIGKVHNGKVEVSCGYVCELDAAPGEWNGIPYDVIQRNIIYNHLAVVDEGRAGPTIRIKLDATDAVQGDALEKPNQKEPEMKLKEITLGGKTFKVNEDVADAILAAHADSVKAENEKATAAEAKVAEMSKERDTLQAKHDTMESEVEKMKKAHADSANVDIKGMVKERMRIEKIAHTVLDSDSITKLDTMSDLEIKKAVICADKKDAKLDGKSEEYINARFDGVVENLDNDDSTASKIAQSFKASHSDASEPADADKARRDSMEKSKNAWKQPLAAVASNK